MIVKNESENIRNCLNSVKKIVDEIIITDTGSNDDTVAVCREFTNAVYTYKWTDDFSAARNYGLSKAAYDWILVMDADERLNLSDLQESAFRDTVNSTAADVWGYYFDRINRSKEHNGIPEWADNVTRLFRNNGIIKFEDKVHEKVDASILRNSKKILKFDAVIEHYGFLDKKHYLDKSRKYGRLLNERLAANPKDYKVYIMLAAEYEKQGLFEQEEELLLTGLRFAPPAELSGFYDKLGILCASHKNDYSHALEWFLNSARAANQMDLETSKKKNAVDSSNVELFVNISKCYYHLQMFDKASEYFEKAFAADRNSVEILRLGISIYDKLDLTGKSVYFADRLLKTAYSTDAALAQALRYLKMNNSIKAKSILLTILNFEPENSKVADLLAQL